MTQRFNNSDFNFTLNEKRGHKKRRFFLILGFFAVLYIFFNTSLLSKKIEIQNEKKEISRTSSQTNREEFNAAWMKRFAGLLFLNQNHAEEADPDYVMPEKEPNRLDILILGIRGEDDKYAQEAGALLTDTIMVFSHDNITKKSSLVSIPRDLYVKIGSGKNKINSAYEYGLFRKEGTDYVKKLVSQITGTYIDNVIVADFSSFEKLVDQLGGIDITLSRPFKEDQQWGYPFELPAGENHIEGRDALYYVRSRFSSNDFDRASRQQQVIFAIKDKLTDLNIITDPIKTLAIIDTLSKSVKTDINIWDIKEIIDLGKEINTSGSMFKKEVLSTDNVLYQSTTSKGLYILLPQGDNFDQIKQLFKTTLN